MKSLFRYIIFLILLNFSFAAKAESIYPIQLYAAMLPPYTNCLGDYINGDMNRLKLSAVVRDMSKHGSTMSISVLMRVKSGNTVYLETTTPVQQIINVQGAMVDIRTENLFTSYDNNAKNLVGRGSFMSNGYCLPEGAYEFVYQVFDGTNKKLPLSEPISIYCFLNQAEPPVGVTPLDGECLDSKTNQNIVFSWMDAVAIGPKYREYSVEVKEQNGAMLASQEGLLPMFGAQSEVNNFTVVTEKSYNTNTLIMQNTSSKFQEGKTYLWRVRAVPTKVKGNADENFAYKNDGYSEWMSFKYGGCGDSVVIPKADSIDMNLRVDMTTVDTSEETGSVVVHWQDIFDNTEVDKYCAYELYVYKADNESAAKTIIPIKDGETKEYTFDNLERGETYKSYIVGLTGCGTPDTIRTPHSDTVSFKLKKPESDSCMVNIDPAKCGKEDLIETLEKGSTFTANDHNVIVTITECKAGSVAGSFTGKGIVSCTIFKDKIGLNVEFEDILVNKSKELCMGTVKVITSEENNLLINLNDLTGKKRTAPKAPSQDYPYTKKVATLDELKKDVEQYKGEVVLVGDKEIYAVGNDGEIEEVGKIVENACRPSKQSLDNSAGLVVFDVDEKYNDPKWTPYIDKSPSPFSYAQIVNGYERIGSYVVPWVSMVQGEARYIKATIQGKTKTTGTGLSGKEKDIKFYCVTDSVMTELNSEYKDGAFKVKVFGGQPDRKLTIVAMMNSTGTADECAKNSKTIGETNIYTMSYRKKTIHLVPVCMDVTGEMGDPKTYADRINKVFAPLGRSYEFKFENKFENDAVKSLLVNGFNTEDGGNVFNNKTPEMKQLCRLYKHDENVKIDHRADAYVFLLDKNTNSKIKGYMPRTNSEGFVFTEDMNVDQIAETMTHELCHGLYGLEHTFKYGIDTMALPENIMSYSTQIGRSPSKYFQWYNIENPSEYHFPFTDSAEDGELYDKEKEKEKELKELTQRVVEEIFNTELSNGNNIVYYKTESQYNEENNNENKEVEGLVGGESKTNTQIFVKYVPGKIELNAGGIQTLSFNDFYNTKSLVYSVESDFKLIEPISDINLNAEFICFKWNGEIYYCYMPPVEGETLGSSLVKHVEDNWQNCAAPTSTEQEDEQQIKSTLNALAQQFRSTQGVEYSANGVAYRLNENGDLEKSTLSNDAINKGQFSGVDEIYRFEKNGKGIFQLSAYGINQNLTNIQGKAVDKEALAKYIKELANEFFVENKVSSPEQKPTQSLDSNAFPDGDKVEIDKDAFFTEIISEAGGIGITFLKTSEVEPQVYYKDANKLPGDSRKNSIIHGPAFFTGVTEGVGQELTDITSMCSMVYGVIVNKEERQKTIDGFKTLKDQVADDPKTLFPLLGDVVLASVTSSTSGDFKEMMDENTDDGRSGHLKTRTVAGTTITVVETAVGGGATMLPSISKKLAQKIRLQKWLKKINLPDGVDTKAFTKTLDDLEDGGEAFLKDFENASEDVIKKVINNPEIIDGWMKAKNWSRPPNREVYIKHYEVYSKLDEKGNYKWVNPETGDIKWPKEDGFVLDAAGNAIKETKKLKVGTILDRFGPNSGSFMSPMDSKGNPFAWEKRSLAPHSDKAANPSVEYHRYQVVKEFEVEAGEIAPAFEQPGGGIQYVTKRSIEELKKSGYLIEL